MLLPVILPSPKRTFDFVQTFFGVACNALSTRYVRLCHQCQTNKCTTIKPSGNIRSLSSTDHPYQRVGIPCLCIFSTSSLVNRWITVAADHLTWHAETNALSKQPLTLPQNFLYIWFFYVMGLPKFFQATAEHNFYPVKCE